MSLVIEGPAKDDQSATILLVDDEASVRTLFAAVLRVLDCRILEAPHGQRAIELLRSYPGAIDLVLLDWRMPVMDGPSFCEAARRLPPDSRPPIVVICTEPDDVERYREDLDAIVRKPISMGELIAHVQSQLAERRTRGQAGASRASGVTPDPRSADHRRRWPLSWWW